jgi:hypothetical protein
MRAKMANERPTIELTRRELETLRTIRGMTKDVSISLSSLHDEPGEFDGHMLGYFLAEAENLAAAISSSTVQEIKKKLLEHVFAPGEG